MMSSDQQFFLKWNDFQTNMVTSFRHLRDEKSFTDVSTRKNLLRCDGKIAIKNVVIDRPLHSRSFEF